MRILSDISDVLTVDRKSGALRSHYATFPELRLGLKSTPGSEAERRISPPKAVRDVRYPSCCRPRDFLGLRSFFSVLSSSILSLLRVRPRIFLPSPSAFFIMVIRFGRDVDIRNPLSIRIEISSDLVRVATTAGSE